MNDLVAFFLAPAKSFVSAVDGPIAPKFRIQHPSVDRRNAAASLSSVSSNNTPLLRQLLDSGILNTISEGSLLKTSGIDRSSLEQHSNQTRLDGFDLVEFHLMQQQMMQHGNITGSVFSLFGAGFISAFVASFSIIIMSELGDKTFFIAALMSMKHNPLVVLIGALGALILMTFLSAVVGSALPKLIDRRYSHFLSVLLFFVFGFRMLYEASHMPSSGENEELEEVEAELSKKSDPPSSSDFEWSPDTPIPFGIQSKHPLHRLHRSQLYSIKRILLARWTLLFSWLDPVFLQAFSLTFLAEWGDRSQVATIALAASKNIWGVNIGAVLGHALCTSIAAVGGKMLASSISERAVTYAGGLLFLTFAIVGIVFDL